MEAEPPPARHAVVKTARGFMIPGRLERETVRILCVSHACVIRENQRPLVHLAAADDVELGLVVPTAWRTSLQGKVRLAIDPALRATVHPLLSDIEW